MLFNALYYMVLVLPIEVRSNLHYMKCQSCAGGARCDEGAELEQAASAARDLYSSRVAH